MAKCCDITAGMLRHTITIEDKSTTDDGCGGQDLAWDPVVTVRAAIKPASGAERLFAERLEASITHKLITRYKPEIKPWMRIKFGDRYFQIRAILNIEERNRFLEIHAQEGVAQ
jgi:SPP1 family predicted phage head-tail adaptor